MSDIINSHSIFTDPFTYLPSKYLILPLLIHRSSLNWLRKKTWRVCPYSSLPTSRTWLQLLPPVRLQRDSTCTHTVTASGRSRPVQLCLARAYRWASARIELTQRPHADKPENSHKKKKRKKVNKGSNIYILQCQSRNNQLNPWL